MTDSSLPGASDQPDEADEAAQADEPAPVDAVDAAEPRVSTFELFFDLVFVFAFTRITESLAEETTWTGLGHAVLVFTVLWWAWGAYAWLTNAVPTEQRSSRLVVLAAMAAMLVVALAVPAAFDDSGAAFAFGYTVVMVLHAVLFALGSDDPVTTRRAIARLGSTNLLGAALLVLAGFSDGTIQTTLWIVAVAITYAGPYLTGVSGFTARPSHFVERHGLIVIIALGESVVAIGAGETSDIDGELVATALVAVALVSALWWAYFDEEIELGERSLRQAEGPERSNLARDVYSYLHIPIVLGIVLTALGVKIALAHSDESLDTVAAVAFGGGVAAYFAALAAIRLRCGLRPRPTQLAAAVLAALAVPLATEISALASLSGLAGITVAVAVADALATGRRGTPSSTPPSPTAGRRGVAG